MGTVADTSLRALALEQSRLRHPLWWQRYLFFRKAKGIHGVHSPLAYRLATEVFMKPGSAPLEMRLKTLLPDCFFKSIAVVPFPEISAHFPETGPFALWVTNISGNRAAWLAACADARITLAIDCFDCGVLLHTPDVKEKQYLRQRRLK